MGPFPKANPKLVTIIGQGTPVEPWVSFSVFKSGQEDVSWDLKQVIDLYKVFSEKGTWWHHVISKHTAAGSSSRSKFIQIIDCLIGTKADWRHQLL